MPDKNVEAEIKVEFEEASSRQSLNSGENTNTLWGKVKKFLSDLKSVAFSGSYNDLSDKPAEYELPTAAKGTLGGVTTSSSVSSSSGYTACPIISGIVYYKDTYPSQSNTGNNAEYRLLLSYYASDSSYSNVATLRKSSKFLANPSTGTLTATTFKGALDGDADTVDGKHADDFAKRAIYADNAINLGRKTGTTVGEGSTAEGYENTASAYYCHAEGQGTQALGNYSHAEGYYTKAETAYDHAEGLNTVAGGGYSHAEGNGCKALMSASHAEGFCTKTTNVAEHACGSYNASTYDITLMSVGDGTSEEKRHNAFEITKTGGNLHDKKIAVVNDIPIPNLLINPNFKINQRGTTGTFSQAGKYFVDGWKLVSGTVAVNADGTLTLNGTISQVLENAAGSSITASASTGTAAYDDSTKKFSLTASGDTISWCKLECGSLATPFIAPDPVAERMKCQRYCVVVPKGRYSRAFFVGTSVVQFLLPLPVPMANAPSVAGGTMGVIPLNLSTAEQADTSFTFSITGIKNNLITVQATKSNGAIDGALFVTEELVLSAEL